MKSNIILSIFIMIIPVTIIITKVLRDSIKAIMPNNNINVHGFVLIERRYYDESNLIVSYYKHKKHGSKFLDIHSEDNNNFFGASVKLIGINNPRINHALQHLTLQGSEKYPENLIIQSLENISYSSFVNGQPSAYMNSYMFTTTNKKDNMNILDVILDSIFHPLLDETRFYSEIHHLEFEEPENPSTKLKHAGVLFNDILEYNMIESVTSKIIYNLYPDSVLRSFSENDYKYISKLSLENIKEHYNRYYHPNNFYFFHYGSFDAQEIMKKINDVIQPFPKKPPVEINETLINQPLWKTPKSIKLLKQGDDSNYNDYLMSWMAGNMSNCIEIFDLEFLSLLLFEHNKSPFNKKLFHYGVRSPIIKYGFVPFAPQPLFSISLKNIYYQEEINFNQTVLDILNEIYLNGFGEQEKIIAIHAYESKMRSGSCQQGMNIFSTIIPKWVSNGDPFKLVDTINEIERVKNILKTKPRYFENVLKKYLIDNTHRLDIIFKNDEKYIEKMHKKIKDELFDIKNNLGSEEKQNIILITRKVRNLTSKTRSLSQLPSIKIDEISKIQEKVNFSVRNDIYEFEQNTNGIIYIKIKCELPLCLLGVEIIPLLANTLVQLASDSKNLEDEIKLNINKIHISTHSFVKNGVTKGYLLLTCNGLASNGRKIIDLLEKILLNPWINNSHVIDNYINKLTSKTITSNDISYLINYASSPFSKACALNELWNGFTQIRGMEGYAKINPNFTKLFHDIYEGAFLKGKFTASIQGKRKDIEFINNNLSQLLTKLNNQVIGNEQPDIITKFQEIFKGTPNKILFRTDSKKYLFICTMPINLSDDRERYVYDVTLGLLCLKSIEIPIANSSQKGPLHICPNFDYLKQVCVFFSFSEVNPRDAYKEIEDSIEDIVNGNISKEMIEHAKIHVLRYVDGPYNPEKIGFDLFMGYTTNREQQKQRERIFSVTKEDIIKIAKELKSAPKRIAALGKYQKEIVPDDYFVTNSTEFL